MPLKISCVSPSSRFALVGVPAFISLLGLFLLPACCSRSIAEEPETSKKSGEVASKQATEKKGEPQSGKEEAEKEKKKDPYAWRPLFDGKSLDHWVVPVFGGDGLVEVEKGAIVLGMGEMITGIRYTGEIPKMNYEIRYEARRTMGNDFFGTITFPYGKEEHCSFVTGGWGGVIAGLSCVDHYDASDNETTTFQVFDDKKWYKFRVRVSEKKIEAWIDKEKVVDLITVNRKISTRSEVDLYCPLGFATWCTEGEIRNIAIRKLRPKEIEKIEKEVAEYHAIYSPYGQSSE
jgi:hypothetical protein